MILDSHAHVDVVPALGWYDTAEKLIGLMDEAGISMAAISGYMNTPGPNPDSIKAIVDAVEAFPDRLIGYVRLDPWYDDQCIDLLEDAILKMGFRGIKLHPAHYTLHPFGELTVKLVRRAGEMGVPVLFHSGDEVMCLPYQIDRLAAQCPETTIILAHIGGFFYGDAALAVAERRGNVLVDTSEIPFPNMIRNAVDRLGPEKVLFGTDAPCCDIKLELKKVELAGLDHFEKHLVLCGNFAKLMNIREGRGANGHN